ncbi:hypothetical protein GO755_08660 [Spirosoma sp. HMF4905]|uniref:AlgX/AlgJ SGNH hydrolase-like domain-containing protein n=1 Tax=Spirosoma arboris TaxID=2682092 RepID=A0A7K1S8F6_9BACT|nr:hypothetical protein [Spirosoma arboris]MVM30102.1 hypothetical protein [Spirosoma arboris]
MRFLRYTVLLFALILWGGGLSTTVSHWLYGIGFITDDYRFGDLYRLSALPQFKLEQPVCPPSHRSSDTASTQLYLIGDSFTEPQRLGQSDFRVSHFQRVSWGNQQRIQLDPGKRNVLIIESVERHFRQHMTYPVSEFIVEKDTNRLGAPKLTLSKRISNDIHRTDVEERLESTLFSQNWAFWFKEIKAALTLDWFNRTNSKVSLSKDQKHLFLHLDTDTTDRLVSSFSKLDDEEVNTLIDSINAVANHYQQLGFDEVYLSIIPNKASILETGRTDYNHLIQRIQTNPRLAVPTIYIYDQFKRSAQSPYLKSDTHWNCEGRSIWLEQVRQKLQI